MRCGSCGTELIPGKAFCHVCGTRVPQACPNCGAQLSAGFRFCPDCGHQIEGDPPAAAPTQADLEPLSPMPAGLAEKIRALGGGRAGERKQVTVLFCDLAGSTSVADGLDPEVFGELLDQYVALALHEIYRFEGIVTQLSGDGFMALFGAPIAHEDAPQRAVWAGIAIRDALAHFNHQLEVERGLSLPARIGINTGPVVVGNVGNDLKMDYTAIGDTTNLASRLESLAKPGTILISETTARLVRGFFHLREVGPLSVKGKSEPVAAFEVIAARDEASPMAVAVERGLTPLVGRDEELAQLDACYRRLAGNFPQVVAVVGDTGGGKSRLIYEFKQRLLLEPDAVHFLEGRCAALSQHVPLSPFVAMLRQYFEFEPGESHESADAKLERRLGKAAADVERAFPLLCRVLSVPAELPADLPLEALKQETFEAIHKIVVAESRRGPVVMIVEDLHWIDEASQQLLEMLVARFVRARVMIVVSHRPDYRPLWRANAAFTELNLRPLLDDDVSQITRALAGGTLPEELEQRILSKAEGSPFFAEEITRSLSEDGYLTRVEGGTQLTRSVDEIFIPGSVREVIAARLDRLGAAAKRTAQFAAVLGRQFSRSELRELLIEEGVDVDHELAELTRRGVIHRKSLFSDDEYRFGESLTQEVAYDSLLLKQRRQLHERVAGLLESGGFEPVLARPSLIAHHYALSDNRAKAVETLLHAAEEAERLPSFRSALELCRQAWELGEAALRERNGGDERFRRWVMQATLGYARMATLYGSSTDPDAERAAIRGRELALELGDRMAAATLRTMHGMLLAADPERFAESVTLTEQAIEETRQVGTALQVISAMRSLVWNYMVDGRFADAQSKVEWLLAELERHGQRESDLYLATRMIRDSVRLYSDDLDGAQRGATETYALALDFPNRTVQAGSANTLAQIHLTRANYDEAREWAERSLATSEAIGNATGVHRGLTLLLVARAALGEPLNVSRHIVAVEEGIAQGGNILLQIYPLVETLLALGDVTRAEKLARLASERAAGRLRVLFAALAVAAVATHRGPSQWVEAEHNLDRATELAAQIGIRSASAMALIGRGRLALARHQVDAARGLWNTAHDICSALGMTHYQQLCVDLLAQSVAPDTVSPAGVETRISA